VKFARRTSSSPRSCQALRSQYSAPSSNRPSGVTRPGASTAASTSRLPCDGSVIGPIQRFSASRSTSSSLVSKDPADSCVAQAPVAARVGTSSIKSLNRIGICTRTGAENSKSVSPSSICGSFRASNSGSERTTPSTIRLGDGPQFQPSRRITLTVHRPITILVMDTRLTLSHLEVLERGFVTFHKH
jgi:hypothetical protein